MCSSLFTGFIYPILLSGAEIGRFVAMLRNPSSVLKACAAFALLQVDLSFSLNYSKELHYHCMKEN